MTETFHPGDRVYPNGVKSYVGRVLVTDIRTGRVLVRYPDPVGDVWTDPADLTRTVRP